MGFLILANADDSASTAFGAFVPPATTPSRILDLSFLGLSGAATPTRRGRDVFRTFAGLYRWCYEIGTEDLESCVDHPDPDTFSLLVIYHLCTLIFFCHKGIADVDARQTTLKKDVFLVVDEKRNCGAAGSFFHVQCTLGADNKPSTEK